MLDNHWYKRCTNNHSSSSIWLFPDKIWYLKLLRHPPIKVDSNSCLLLLALFVIIFKPIEGPEEIAKCKVYLVVVTTVLGFTKVANFFYIIVWNAQAPCIKYLLISVGQKILALIVLPWLNQDIRTFEGQ